MNPTHIQRASGTLLLIAFAYFWAPHFSSVLREEPLETEPSVVLAAVTSLLLVFWSVGSVLYGLVLMIWGKGSAMGGIALLLELLFVASLAVYLRSWGADLNSLLSTPRPFQAVLILVPVVALIDLVLSRKVEPVRPFTF